MSNIETYEQKYKNALSKARNIVNSINVGLIGKDSFEAVFPELKENGDENADEKVRKALIKLVTNHASMDLFIEYDIHLDEALSWLEKQGKQKSIDDLTQQEAMDIAVAKCFEQGKQKSADMVEPKFKVGDWVICCDYEPVQIISIRANAYYEMSNGDSRPFYMVDNNPNIRPWNIQDAKDGDVLAFDNDTIVIFKDLYNSTTFHSYCHIEDGLFDVSKDDMPDWWEGKGFQPATKEQRTELFQKMKEAGYEWDSEKKEPKKIIDEKQIKKNLQDNGFRRMFEQKPAWSEEDERIYQSIMDDTVQENQLNDKQTNWLRDIKYRYFTQPKQEWSEEDEEMIVCLNNFLDELAEENGWRYVYVNNKKLNKVRNWLKSIKPQQLNKWSEEDKKIYGRRKEI
jgi:hypothetical protein